MIDLVEDIQPFKKVYVLNTNLWRANKIDFAVYSVTKLEHIGVNKWFVHLKSNAIKSNFPKTLYAKGLMLRFGGRSDYRCYSDFKSMQKDFCYLLKKEPEKNKNLTKKMMDLFPQYFV